MDSINENKAVGRLAEILALERGYGPAKARQIGIAGALHDIGKQSIDAGILNKPGKLDRNEREQMKMHTINGGLMLRSLRGELGEMARLCCVYHHEWHDGNGYWGRRMGGLPYYLPLVAISDVFVALVCERPYKQAWPPKEATNYIQKQAGTQFDPGLVQEFLTLTRDDSRVAAIFTQQGR